MKAREIKEYIFENEKVEYILEKLGMLVGCLRYLP